jgi:hypothetical protein
MPPMAAHLIPSHHSVRSRHHAIFLSRRVVGKYDAPGRLLPEQRVTSNSPEAPVEYATVSPDGKYLAYSDPTGLYLRVIASAETRR